jgi:hypothetical protein
MEQHGIRTLNLGTQFGYNLAVHLYYASLDEAVGLATAAYTGISQEFVQTDWFIGINVSLLVLNLLLHAVLGVGIVTACTWTHTGSSTLRSIACSCATIVTASAWTLLIASFAACIVARTGLITSFAWLTGLIASFASCIIARTGLVTSFAWLTGLIAAFSACVIARTGLIRPTGLSF